MNENFKIALIGYGKMGQEIEKIALQDDLSISAKIYPSAKDPKYQTISASPLEDSHVCIEFTNPESALANIEALAKLKKNIVVGTTGWYDKLPKVQELVNDYQIGLVWGENFSLGMQLFLKLVERAGALLKKCPEYKVEGWEEEHSQKKDTPSGTAHAIAQALDQEIHFHSLRMGQVPGIHTLLLDSDWDSISLCHQAKNRQGFAKGALLAAHWISNRVGLYHVREML